MINRSMYAGFAILDLSKTVIYNFFYGFLKPKYGENCNLLYTDTDSLIVHIKIDNFYIDMTEVGRMKDEYAGKVPSCFLGTCAKSYFLEVEGVATKKAKGVRKDATRDCLDREHYNQVVMGAVDHVLCKMYVFRSYSHTVYSERFNKIALSAQDNKRSQIEGSPYTYAW